MAFEVSPPSGNTFMLDSHPEFGGGNKGPTPVEALLGALAACTAMDVISILQKKRQDVTSYRIEVEGVRPPTGEYPRPFNSISLKHILSGPDLDPEAVARAIQLSDEKYCSVMATLRMGPEIHTSWEIASPVSSGI